MLDFGLAKLAAAAPDHATVEALDMTSPGVVMGTASYMSPEQTLGKDLDHRTDVFSLGTVLYEMITARRAFAGTTPAEVFDAILNRAPAAPMELNPGIPNELPRIITKALEKDPDLRYQSAAGLRADLKTLKRDTASGPSAQSVQKSASSINWWPAAAIAVLAVAALWATSPWGSGGKLTTIGTDRLTFSAGPEFGSNLSPAWHP